MNNYDKKNYNKNKERTPNGVWITYPDNIIIGKMDHEDLETIAKSSEQVSDRKVHGVHLNEDRENPGKLHSITVVFDKNT